MSLKTCTEWATESYQECAEYRDDGYQACAEYRDDGYNACAGWRSECCDWWPCSWLCEIVSWFCYAWYWVSNIVCVSYYWVANLVCVVWTTVVTAVCIAWEVITVILTPLSFILELILSIPVIGRILAEILSIIQEIIWRIAGLLDALLGLIGIRLLKKLHINIIILRDNTGNPVSTVANLDPHIEAARTIYRDQANVHLITDCVKTVKANSPDYALDVNCDAAAWAEDLLLAGSYFEFNKALYCPADGTSRLTGLSAPITVFVVRDIPGNTEGCSLGPLSDYVTVQGNNPICIAHEIGHACGLWHISTAGNLANPACGGTNMTWWQRIIVRDSRFVSYI